MNDQAKMNAVKQFLTMFFSALTILMPSLATSQQYSMLTTTILTAVPALCTLGSMAWSLYSHWNMKKVPDNSTALKLPGAPEPVGTVVDLTPMKGLAQVVGILLACVVLLGALPAQAANGVTFKKLKPLSDIVKPAPATPAPAPQPATSNDPLADLMDKIEKVKAEDIAAIVVDINTADVDASTVVTPEIPATPAVPAVLAADGVTVVTPAVAAVPATPAVVKDPISHACYPASVRFLQSLPVAAKLTGKFVGVQLFQQKRDFVAQLQAGLPVYLKLGCAPLLGDEITTFVKIMAMVGIKILPAAAAALMPALAPITLPAMTLAP